MDKKYFELDDLILLMSKLRDSKKGCPWDLKQNFHTIKSHTIEEAYEVADAIERNNMDSLKDELGDLLFQVIFHSQMAAEQNLFDIKDVINQVTKKMLFRHPHIFEKPMSVTAEYVENNIWEEQKEKENINNVQDSRYCLDDLTMHLPSLSLANKIQKKVRKIGFKHNNFQNMIEKIYEEISELKTACDEDNKANIEEEFGDLLFATALLGEELNIKAEYALRKACQKFIKRFNAVEDHLIKNDKTLKTSTTTDMIEAWHQIKVDKEKL